MSIIIPVAFLGVAFIACLFGFGNCLKMHKENKAMENHFSRLEREGNRFIMEDGTCYLMGIICPECGKACIHNCSGGYWCVQCEHSVK